jgi:hypothetical protein
MLVYCDSVILICIDALPVEVEVDTAHGSAPTSFHTALANRCG